MFLSASMPSSCFSSLHHLTAYQVLQARAFLTSPMPPPALMNLP
jgi:hypothetical protein